MPLYTLPLNPIVDVTVNLDSTSVAGRGFNLALIVGATTVIPQAERVREYYNTDDMLTDGFLTSDRLYKAAQLLFGQVRRPQRILVGCIGTVEENDGSGGTTTRAETPLEAVTACRQINGEWYTCTVCSNLVNADHIAIAEYLNSNIVSSIYCYTTNDSNVLTTSGLGIFAQMKALKYRRAFGQYSTNHLDAVCAILGWVMGTMSLYPIPGFTLMFKDQIGVKAENDGVIFPETFVKQIQGDYGNVYVNRGTYFNIFTDGRLSDGLWFDELIFADKAVYDIQIAVAVAFKRSGKIDQEETGAAIISQVIGTVCEQMVMGNVIGAGVWGGDNILALSKGDTLPRGYLVQHLPVAMQSPIDRAARKSVPFFVSLNFTGAIHSTTIALTFDR